VVIRVERMGGKWEAFHRTSGELDGSQGFQRRSAVR
jgi:hypothetical protein